uniref:G_PROTEIN_RECEP_F1_2 domain-containing protein n=1 Tax=Panagrellus redivivus TaxID=6233 RepID=A0A7E4UXZ2_PANRE
MATIIDDDLDQASSYVHANGTSFDECADFRSSYIVTSDEPDDESHFPELLNLLFALPVSVIILLTVFGNLLVLCFKARVGRTNTTLLVWNLGLTDFLVGVFVLPLGAIHHITRKWIFGRILCRFWVAADVTFCTCSVVTICVISVDRYLAVTRPLRYKSVVTKCKVICVMITIWIFSSSILLATIKWDQSKCVDDQICFAGNEIRYLAHSVVCAFFLPASVTLTLYWRIYKLARNRQRALDRGFLMIFGQNMNFLTNTISQSTALRVHFGRNSGMVEHQRRVLRTHERIAKTLGVVSCSFLFCWLPFFLLYLTNFQCKGCISPVFIDVASWLGYCNSMLNPIIYSFTVKEFKRSALRAIVPAWKLMHRILPICFKEPPEHAGARMSRNGNRAKARPRSCEVRRKQTNIVPVRMPTKRRQTEPAVFAVVDVKKANHSPLLGDMSPIVEEAHNIGAPDDYACSITSDRMHTGLEGVVTSETSPNDETAQLPGCEDRKNG